MDKEWKLAEQLHDSLKVCFLIASTWHLHSGCHLTAAITTSLLLSSHVFYSCCHQNSTCCWTCPTIVPSQQILKDATHFFSHPMPNLACVIPAMDHIEETLSTGSLNMSNDPAIHAVLTITWKTLNHYYGLTNSSEVYHIAMGELHYSFLKCFQAQLILLCVLNSITSMAQTHILSNGTVG